MISYGGWASFNGVNFRSENYIVHAFRKKEGIKVTITELEKDEKPGLLSKVDDILSGIPFIRGLWLIIYNLFVQWKMLILLTVITFPLTMLPGKFYPGGSMNMNFSSLLLTLLVMGLLCKVSSLGKYHAAEHMAGNTYDDEQALTIDNISCHSRIHERCGTNLVTIILTLFIVFYLITKQYLFSFIITESVGYELFRLRESKYKFARYLIAPFFVIGKTCQLLFFTSHPQKNHLEVAKTSLQKLIDLENRHNCQSQAFKQESYSSKK